MSQENVEIVRRAFAEFGGGHPARGPEEAERTVGVEAVVRAPPTSVNGLRKMRNSHGVASLSPGGKRRTRGT